MEIFFFYYLNVTDIEMYIIQLSNRIKTNFLLLKILEMNFLNTLSMGGGGVITWLVGRMKNAEIFKIPLSLDKLSSHSLPQIQ